MSQIASRAWLLAGIAAVSSFGVPQSAAFANSAVIADADLDQAGVDAVVEGDEIVVTGIRSALNQALNTKRQAPVIVDAISSEDVGKFPDTNIAESVQRITGVQINRSRGEGRTVNIRGLPSDFTLVTLNGRTLPNALSGSSKSRSFDFSILPPEFVSTLEVFKSPSANVEEGGLSGVVNIKTVRAFDLREPLFAVSAQGQYESNNASVSPRLSAAYANTFLDGRLGVSLGVAYSHRKPEIHENNVTYTTVTEGNGLRSSGRVDLNGDGVIDDDRLIRLPNNVFYTIYQEDVKRLSGIGSIDFAATDNLTLSLDGFYSELTARNTRNPSNNSFYGASNVISAKTEILNGIETVTEFEVEGADVRNNGRLDDSDGYLGSTSLGARYEKDGWTAQISGAYSRSRQISNNLNTANAVYGNARYVAKPGDKVVSVTYIDGFDESRLDASQTRIININGTYDQESTDTQYEARADVSYEWGGGLFNAVHFGAKYTDRTKYEDNWTLSITPAGVSRLYGGLPVGPVPGSVSAEPLMKPISAGSGSFLGSYSGDAQFPLSWLRSDTRSFLKGKTKEELLAVGRYTNDATGITDVKERTFAAYARGDFETGAFSGNIGLRAVRTSQETVGVSPDLSAITYEFAGGFTRVPAAEPITVKRSYWDFLPSVNVKFDASDDVVIRFAAARTMARPNLTQISPTVSADGIQRTITQNNPHLDPFRADNFDLSAEWYFAKSSLLSASLFYKDIKSLIRNETVLVTLPVTYLMPDQSTSTQTMEFQRNSLVNGKGVQVKGFELAYQQAFTFLPAPLDGFGTILNYTFIDNSDPKELSAASKHNFNATGYYEKGPIGLRLSYSWRSSFLSQSASSPLMSTYTRSFGTLDGSINVKLNDTVSLVLEAVNLTDADTSTYHDTLLPASYVDAGRRFTFGARARF